PVTATQVQPRFAGLLAMAAGAVGLEDRHYVRLEPGARGRRGYRLFWQAAVRRGRGGRAYQPQAGADDASRSGQAEPSRPSWGCHDRTPSIFAEGPLAGARGLAQARDRPAALGDDRLGPALGVGPLGIQVD